MSRTRLQPVSSARRGTCRVNNHQYSDFFVIYLNCCYQHAKFTDDTFTYYQYAQALSSVELVKDLRAHCWQIIICTSEISIKRGDVKSIIGSIFNRIIGNRLPYCAPAALIWLWNSTARRTFSVHYGTLSWFVWRRCAAPAEVTSFSNFLNIFNTFHYL